MDLKTFHQKALNIVAKYKMSKIYVGVDVSWQLQSVGGNELLCTSQITAVAVNNRYINIKEVTPEAALSVFDAKMGEIAESKNVSQGMYFNQQPAQA